MYYLKIEISSGTKNAINEHTLKPNPFNIMDQISCIKQELEFHWWKGLCFGGKKCARLSEGLQKVDQKL